ncbi:hypothetical protein GCM10020254_73960 [Streptomyces goshikiensis]
MPYEFDRELLGQRLPVERRGGPFDRGEQVVHLTVIAHQLLDDIRTMSHVTAPFRSAVAGRSAGRPARTHPATELTRARSDARELPGAPGTDVMAGRAAGTARARFPDEGPAMRTTGTAIPLRAAAGAVAAALLALLSAAGPASAGGPGGGDGGDGGRGVVLRWKPCTRNAQAGFECAVAKVPLDHAEPSGRTIDLAVIRHRAAAAGGAPPDRCSSTPADPAAPGRSDCPSCTASSPPS